MHWDAVASPLLFAVVIQIILIPITLIYYAKQVQRNIDRVFWKIRRPKYFLFYILITLLTDIIRCTNGLLLHIGLMTPYWYNILSVPLAYFGGITWGSIRLWLLYYDIKRARKSQLFLLSKHLTTLSATDSFSYGNNDDANHAIETPYTQQKQYKSVTLKVFTAVIIFCIITLFIDIVLGLTQISKLLLYSFILLVLSFYTYFLFKLCCCCHCNCNCKSRSNYNLQSSPFRDDWLLLLELTIIWIVWIIGIFGALFFFPFRGQPIYHVLIVYLTMSTRVVITLTMLILPYKVSLRLNESNAKTITLSVLKNVLSTKSYFYSFIEHLVQELAIENLTVLVEMWQFKYEQMYHLKPLKVSEKINAKIEESRTKDQSKTRTNSAMSEWFREVTPTIDYDETHNTLQLGNNAHAMSRSNVEDTRKMIEFLHQLPWRRLPLAQSIASHLSQTDEFDMENKWQQCLMIYTKYFDENSYDSVNVSYGTKHEVNNNYHNVMHYIQSKEEELHSSAGADTADVNGMDSGIDSVRMVAIENDEQMKERLLTVFDVAIDDIVHNLRDCLTRFVLSEEFKLAH